jgi:23S rRNA (guanosine2251-2'-O)-methyltransferase
MREIVLIAHDIRSAHNVGSLLRTADGFGVTQVYLTGYTPYPKQTQDVRLPHLSTKLTKQISKTALGAETDTSLWTHHEDIKILLDELRANKYIIIGLEQAENSIQLPKFIPSEKVAILLGREVEGVEPELLKLCDKTIEIPMYGKKESFNVIEAATAAIYHCRFHPF